MKLPQYRLLKISAKDHTTLEAEWVDFVTCGECKYRYMDNNTWVCPFGLMLKGDDGYCNYGERGE